MILPADHAERRRALDPSRSFIVQAPAGAGKTELLIQRYLTLLAGVDDPEQVLALTFTRKAAGEMRARVVDALRRAAAEPEPTGENQRLTWRLARTALAADGRMAWNLLAAPARIRIETIDALCARIARRMPWLARFGAMPGIVEDPREIYAEAARDTLRLLAGRQYGPAVEKLALHLDNDLDRAERLLVTMLEKRDQWLRHLGSGLGAENPREVLEQTLGAVVAAGVARVRSLYPARLELPSIELARFAARNLARENPEHPLTRCAALTALPAAIEEWLALAELLLTGSGEWRRKADKRLGFPSAHPRQKQELSSLLDQLARVDGLESALAGLRELPAPRYTGAQWEFLESVFLLLPAAAAQLKAAFQRRGVVDFTELGEAARRALGPADAPTDLALAFGHRLEHILIDEVQDTSVTHIELLKSLIAGWEGRGTLFLVGDPMQSIYRFREAEVGLFLSIRADGLAHVAPEPLTLRVNFRSRPAVVDWVNANLAPVFPQSEDPLTGAVSYSPSTAFRPAGDGPAVTLHPFLEDDPEAEAQAVAAIAAASSAGSTAILVRARTHLDAIVAELRRRGIRYRAVEIDLLAERPVVRDLLAIARAALHPADRIAWLALLRAPWCGATLDQLHGIATADRFAPLFDLLPGDDPRIDRVRRAMSAAAAECRRVPLRDCVERAWIAMGGPECVRGDTDRSDARRLLALLDELEQGGEIADPEALEARVGKLFAEPDAAAPGGLEAMTIHRAKGLEFDTVIVPGLGYGAGQEEERLLHWAELPSPQGPRLLFAPVESREDERDPTLRYLRRLEREKVRQEAARLLYVACTRARERLHLLGHTTVKDGALASPRAGSLLERLWPSVRDRFSAALADSAPREVPPAGPAPPVLRRVAGHWQPAPQPPGIEWHGRAAPPVSEVSFDWAGDTLRHVGTVVHAILDRIAGTGPYVPGSEIRTALESLGVPPAELDAAAERVGRAIATTLEDPRGRWILEPRPIAESEFSATMAEGGLLRSVTVDRTFVDPDNIRWIVDYKTSEHSGGDLDGFLDNEVARYRGQLEMYARLFRSLESRPVRCGLYFPLLASWREWEPEPATSSED